MTAMKQFHYVVVGYRTDDGTVLLDTDLDTTQILFPDGNMFDPNDEEWHDPNDVYDDEKADTVIYHTLMKALE